jgi:hypothetical protein
MGTVGEAAWGIVISSAWSSGPSGNECRFFTDNIKRKFISRDEVEHLAGQSSFVVPLKEVFYTVQIGDARVAGNSMTTLNSYHGYLYSWDKDKTKVYFSAKDSDGNYMDFIIQDTTYNYLKCVITDYEDHLSHEQYKITLKVEECQ